MCVGVRGGAFEGGGVEKKYSVLCTLQRERWGLDRTEQVRWMNEKERKRCVVLLGRERRHVVGKRSEPWLVGCARIVVEIEQLLLTT